MRVTIGLHKTSIFLFIIVIILVFTFVNDELFHRISRDSCLALFALLAAFFKLRKNPPAIGFFLFVFFVFPNNLFEVCCKAMPWTHNPDSKVISLFVKIVGSLLIF